MTRTNRSVFHREQRARRDERNPSGYAGVPSLHPVIKQTGEPKILTDRSRTSIHVSVAWCFPTHKYASVREQINRRHGNIDGSCLRGIAIFSWHSLLLSRIIQAFFFFSRVTWSEVCRIKKKKKKKSKRLTRYDVDPSSSESRRMKRRRSGIDRSHGSPGA